MKIAGKISLLTYLALLRRACAAILPESIQPISTVTSGASGTFLSMTSRYFQSHTVSTGGVTDKIYSVVAYDTSTNNLKLMDLSGNIKGATTAPLNVQSTVLSPNMKIYFSQYTGSWMSKCGLQVNGGLYTITNEMILSSTPYQTGLLVPATTYVAHAGNTQLTIFDENINSVVQTVTLTNMNTIGAFFLEPWNQILRVADKNLLQVIELSTFTITSSYTNLIFFGPSSTKDSGNDSIVYIGEYSNPINKVLLNSVSATASILVVFPLSGYGAVNRLYNYKTIDLLLTIPSGTTNPRIVFINKADMTLISDTFIFTQSVFGATVSYIPMPGDLHFDYDFMYITLSFNSPNQYFHIYGLRLNNCTSRNPSGVCTLCRPGTYTTDLNPSNQCVHPDTFPQLYGIVIGSLGPTASLCTARGCTECKYDNSGCTLCQVNYLLVGSGCEPTKGWGFDNGTMNIRQCLQSNCLACTFDYFGCVECSEGYFAESSLCRSNTRSIVFTSNWFEKVNSREVGSFLLSTTSSDQNLPEIWEIVKKFEYKVRFEKKGDNSLIYNIPYRIEIGTLRTDLELNLRFDKDTIEPLNYSIFLVQKEPFELSLRGTNYEILIYGSFFDYHLEAKSSIEKNKISQSVSSASQTVQTTISPKTDASLFYFGAIMMVDPTGSFFRFTKYFQIASKFYFININYGKDLDAFLYKSATITSEDWDYQVRHSSKYRGKLSYKQINLNSISLMKYKMGAYFFSWIIQVLSNLALENCLLSKASLYVYYYSKKVHLVIFNVVFVDFVWYGARTLLHSRGLSYANIQLTVIGLLLIYIDLWRIIRSLFDNKLWRKAFGFNRKISVSTHSKDTTRVSAKSNTREVDYQRTNERLRFNDHLFDMIVANLKLTPAVYSSRLCRILASFMWFKVLIIELVILGCQYASLLGIVSICIFECVKLILTLFAYLRYKYMNNIVCITIEVTQSISIILFMMNAILMSHKQKGETISDSHQRFGILITIISTAMEFILFIVYIGYLLTQKIKANKKKPNEKISDKKIKNQLIIYFDKIEEGPVDFKLREIYYHGGNKVSFMKSIKVKAHPNRLHQTKRKLKII